MRSHTGRATTRATDPRIERSRTLVRRAVLAVLGERGWGGLTIESVAARAGTARSTIYRHWPNRLALVTDALEVLNQQPVPTLEDQAPRARVRTLLTHLATALTDPALSACVAALIEAAEQHPEVREFLHGYSARRRQALVEAIAAGVRAGDFPATTEPELAAQALSGAIFYRRFMTGEPLTPDGIDALMSPILEC